MLAAAAAVPLLAMPGDAAADHCVPEATASAEADHASVAASLQAASFRTERYEGSWLGARTDVRARFGRWRAGASLPVYRLERNGLASDGLGDLAGDLRFEALQRDAFSFGPHVAATAPTGDARDELGMGHAMAAGGLWAAWHGTGGFGSLATWYARSLASTAGHHHGPAPLVDPMNASEAAVAASLGAHLTPALTIAADALYAEPVALSAGERRAWAGGGASVATGAVDVTAALHLPIVGDPFTVRTTVAVRLRL